MENAGAGAARRIHQIADDRNIVILCGKGNNAGDGYVIARHLELMDRQTILVSIVETDELTGDAAANFQIAKRCEIPMVVVHDECELASQLSGAGTILDCLLGTGATGPLRGLYASAVRLSNRIDALRVAIDVPTGMDCDSGEVSDDAFRANETITFVAEKKAMTLPSTHKFVGKIHVVSIGAPRCLLKQYER